MLRHARSLILGFASFAAALSASADMLVHDGFSSDVYPTGSVKGKPGKKVDGIDGFASTGFLNNNTGVIVAFADGLSFPSCMSESFTATAGSIGFNHTYKSGNDNVRMQAKFLADNIWPTQVGDKVYFRLLCSTDQKSMTELASAAGIQSGKTAAANFRGMGFAYKASNTSNELFNDALNAGNPAFWFGFVKNAAGNVTVSLVVKGEGTTIQVYPLVAEVEADTTYLCCAEISVGAAGVDGDIFKAFAVNVADYTGLPNWATLSGDGTAKGKVLTGGTNKPNTFAIGGAFGTNNGIVKFDEIGVATTMEELIYVAAGDLPAIERVQAEYESGDLKLAITLGTTAATTLGVVATADGETQVRTEVPGSYSPEATHTVTASGLAADTTYRVSALAGNAEGEVVLAVGNVYHGQPSLAKIADIEELDLKPGQVRISRRDASPYPVTVKYAVSSETAVAGRSYVVPSGTIEIPAHEMSAILEIRPLFDNDLTEDATLTVTVLDGACPGGATIDLTLVNTDVPEAYNVWLAAPGSDGLASTGANWSKGRVPVETDDILVNGQFSNEDLTWDVESGNGLPTRVASWTQSALYTGTVTIPTKYPTAPNAAFTEFAVSGKLQLDGGVWTHPLSCNLDDQTVAPKTIAELREKAVYRLNVTAGSFELGAAARIDVREKGHAQRKVATQATCKIIPAHGGAFLYTSGEGEFAAASNIIGYGDPKNPEDIGLAGNTGTDNAAVHAVGGGAVRLTVTGAAVVNGTITADSAKASGLSVSAGGAIRLEAESVSGRGVISSDGVTVGNSSSRSGVGGRVAVIARTTLDASALTITAKNHNPNPPTENWGVYYGAPGTVYLRDAEHPNGILRVIGETPKRVQANAVVPVTGEGDWTFDAVVLGGTARLYVGEETTLTLPNGLASVSTVDDTLYDTIIVDKGTLALPAGDQTMSGAWMLEPWTTVRLSGNLTMSGRSRIGICPTTMTGTNHVLGVSLVVDGDLTVGADAAIDVSGVYRGENKEENLGLEGVHGGQARSRYANAVNVYDSVFAPSLPGWAQARDNKDALYASGIVDLTVCGALHLEGAIRAGGNGYLYESATSVPGAGGSIKVVAGTIDGNGSILADGSFGDATKGGAAGGGRVAVKLTAKDAVMPETVTLGARGYSYPDGRGLNSASAGTVYVETADENARCGVLTIANRGKTYAYDPSQDTVNTNLANVTPIVPTGFGGDRVSSFRRTKLVVANAAVAQVNVDGLVLGALTIAAAEPNQALLDLNGKTLCVKSAVLGGRKLAYGTYSVADLAPYVVDYSSSADGVLKVLGSGLSIVLR